MNILSFAHIGRQTKQIFLCGNPRQRLRDVVHLLSAAPPTPRSCLLLPVVVVGLEAGIDADGQLARPGAWLVSAPTTLLLRFATIHLDTLLKCPRSLKGMSCAQIDLPFFSNPFEMSKNLPFSSSWFCQLAMWHLAVKIDKSTDKALTWV